MSEGSRRQLIYVAEVTQGTTPATPVCKPLRNTGGGGIKVARQSLQSAEYRQDRAIAGVRLGNKTPTLDVPFEFSYTSFDEFLEAALFGSWTTNVLKQGVTKKFFTVEEGFTDIAQYQTLTGAMVNDFSLDIKPNAMITGSFSLLGLVASAFAGSSIDANPEAAETASPFDSYTGSLKEGGASIAIVTGLSLKLANGLEHFFALFNKDPAKIGVGRANLTGTLSCYFESAAMANKFLAETESSLEFTLTDLAGNSYTFLVPRIKYTGADRTLAENNISIDLPFQALYDPTEATALKITRTPHA